MSFSVNEINKIFGFENSRNFNNKEYTFKRISIDSRNISNNDLFIAIQGNRFDGHDFIQEVIKKGVKGLIISNDKRHLIPDNYTYWAVPDTKEAFQKLALFKRRNLNIPVVAITGSVGKTTTKEITGSILKDFGKIKISAKNNNNEIGVASTILESDKEDKLLILEMGMRGLGQIENLSKFTEPDIAVITNIGSSHIGLLGSRENIAKAKCEIVKYLNPKGVVIIPSNDKLLDSTLNKVWRGRVLRINLISVEESQKYNYDLKNVVLGLYDSKNNLLNIEEKKFELSFKGIHNAYNFLFAYAISQEFGIKFKNYNYFKFKSITGRNKIIKRKKVTILDETYNASPESVKACIFLLLEYPGKHFLVLGSMKELGTMSTKYHLEILNLVNEVDIECCIFICDKIEEMNISEKFVSKKVIFKNNKSNIGQIINSKTNKNDHVLVKGSRYWKLEEIIPFIV